MKKHIKSFGKFINESALEDGYEHKRPHYGDGSTTQYGPILNFDNLVRFGFRKSSSGSIVQYINISQATGTAYYLRANGTNGHGSYIAVGMGTRRSGAWKFTDDTDAGVTCPSNIPDCSIFDGVRFITSVKE